MRNDPVISEGEHRQFRCLHTLEQLDPAKEHGFKYRCLKCDKYMKRLNGIIVRQLWPGRTIGTMPQFNAANVGHVEQSNRPKITLENQAKVG